MSSGLFDTATKALGSSINFRQLRHAVTSGNIANAETPGYKAKKLDFEGALSRAIEMEKKPHLYTTHPDHFAIGPGSMARVRADVYDNPDVNTTNDGNTVDMEKEMAKMAENSILYKGAVEAIRKKLGALKYAVTEGGR